MMNSGSMNGLKNTLRNNIQRHAKEDDIIILSIDALF